MKWVGLFCLGLVVSCSTHTAKEKSDLDEIVELMGQQEKAWNNADIEGFMKPYWQSDSLVFIGSRGITYGWLTTLNNYKKSYSTPEEMGILKFENEIVKPLGHKSAYVVGKWNLYREADTLNGSYMLVWRLIDGHWRIVADHSS